MTRLRELWRGSVPWSWHIERPERMRCLSISRRASGWLMLLSGAIVFGVFRCHAVKHPTQLARSVT